MNRRLPVLFAALALLAGWTACTTTRRETFSAYGKVEDDRWTLWVAIHKGFHGTVRYVGTEHDYSYFRAGTFRNERFKVKTSTLRLPRTFRIGDAEPYVVLRDMVP